jgi:hypothetical protein
LKYFLNAPVTGFAVGYGKVKSIFGASTIIDDFLDAQAERK